MSDVFRLYCGLEAGQTVKDMCMVHDLRTMNVDERYIYTVCTCTCMCMQMTKCMVTFPFSLFHNCTICQQNADSIWADAWNHPSPTKISSIGGS